MSRIGKAPVAVPDKTKVEINGQHIAVTGPKGTLQRDIHPDIKAVLDGPTVVVTRSTDQKRHKALHGLTRTLIANMLEGVAHGYTRELLIVGVGFRAEMKGRHLQLYLGYSHPILFQPPEGVKLDMVPKENKIIVTGIDKELVGQVAAKLRSFRKPDAYKGKGIRYADELVHTKAGKTAGA
jgi:large subunit ribosomal protein L6